MVSPENVVDFLAFFFFAEPSDYRSEGMRGSYDQVRSNALSTSRDLIDLSALVRSLHIFRFCVLILS